jgi:multidrug efflux pump subunit AcrA (membrane-fusion protein)
VRVGDEVKAGDVLAELDLKDYQNAIKAAELELENAKLGLSKLLNNDTSLAQAKVRSQIKEAELSLQVESQQYDVLKKQLATTLQQKKDQLLQLNREYDLAKKELDIE